MPAYNANLPVNQANPSLGRRGLGNQGDDLPPPGVRTLDGQISPPYASVRSYLNLPLLSGGPQANFAAPETVISAPVETTPAGRAGNKTQTPNPPATAKPFNILDPLGIFSK